ncbi:MAG: hypothetical protein Q9183_003794 [Haloplaca sp. 2 TL-2023]
MRHTALVTTASITKYLAGFLLLIGILSTDATPISSYTSHRSLTSRLANHEIYRGKTHHTEPNASHAETRGLQKRGICRPSRSRDGNNVELDETPAVPVWECSPDAPTVDECEAKIREHGQVPTKVSVFYTGLQGRVGIEQCKSKLACLQGIGETVLFDNIVDNGWYVAQATAIVEGNENLSFNIPTGALDDFQKRLSQAFGQAAQGTAYICMPDEEDPDDVFRREKAWGGWEYPALTRNRLVTSVIRFDPTKDNYDPRQIWQPSDGPTPNEPRG